jgi:hypothetical protein
MSLRRSVVAALSSLLFGSCATADYGYKPTDVEHRNIENAIIHKVNIGRGQVVCVYNVLGARQFSAGVTKFYVIAETTGFVKRNNQAYAESGTVGPIVVTMTPQLVDSPGGGKFTHIGITTEVPRDGGDYANDIKTLFPSHLHKTILSGEAAKPLNELIKVKAAAALNVKPEQVRL